MSSQPITDGLYVYDYLSYQYAARQKMSKETRQNVDRLGAKMEAVAGRQADSSDQGKLANLLLKLNKPASDEDLTAVLKEVDDAADILKDAKPRIKDTLIMRDLADYRAEALKKVDPKTAARAKDALTLEAVEGLTQSGRWAVIALGRMHLQTHQNSSDLAHLLTGNQVINALHNDGVILAEDTVFEVGGVKIKFAKGEKVRFYPDGAVTEGVLAEETTIKVGGVEYKFAKASSITFYPDGSVDGGTLAADTKVTIKGQEITLKKGGGIEFHENGAVANGWLAADTTINGYKLSLNSPVSFFDDGVLGSGKLAEGRAFTIGGAAMNFAAGTKVGFYHDGKLSEVRPAVEMTFTVAGVQVKNPKDEEVVLHENGNIRYIMPAEDVVLTVEGQKVKFAKERYLDFFSNGDFEAGFLAEDTTFTVDKKKITLPKGVKIYVSAAGKLEKIELREKTTIGGKEFETGEHTIQSVMDVLYPPAAK